MGVIDNVYDERAEAVLTIVVIGGIDGDGDAVTRWKYEIRRDSFFLLMTHLISVKRVFKKKLVL